MITMKELGAFVAAVRRKQGVKQLQISQAANVGRRFVVEMEDGKDTIQAGKLLHVMDVLGININLMEPLGV